MDSKQGTLSDISLGLKTSRPMSADVDNTAEAIGPLNPLQHLSTAENGTQLLFKSTLRLHITNNQQIISYGANQ